MLPVNRLVEDWNAQRPERRYLLVAGFICSSIVMYLGVGVIALTLSQRETSWRDLLFGFLMIALSLMLNAGIASLLTRTGARWTPRFIWSWIVSATGAALTFGVVAARLAFVR